jgi:hypothetical protein
MSEEIVFVVSWPSGKVDQFRVNREPEKLVINLDSADYEATYELPATKFAEFNKCFDFPESADPMAVITWMLSAGDRRALADALQEISNRVSSWSNYF